MLKSLKNIWSFTRSEHKSLVISLIFSFLRSLFSITEIISIIVMINAVLGKIEIKKGIIIISILMLSCILGNFLTSYIEQTLELKTGYLVVAEKRISLGSLLSKLPLGYFNKNNSTKLAATLTTTMSGMEQAIVMVMVGIISGLFNAIALFIFMCYYEPKQAIILLIGTILYLLIVSYQMKLSRKNAPKTSMAQNNLASSTLNFLQGIKVIKAFSVVNGDENLNKAILESEKENINLTRKTMPSEYLASITIKVFESLILILTCYLSFVTHEIDLTKTIVLLIFSFMAFSALNQAGSMLSMIGLLDNGLAETKKLESEKPLEIKEPTSIPKNNEIKFNDVSFSYGKFEVLHHLTTTIKEGELTAIIGPSGSGKTTFCELIPRFFEINSGSITIGGVDIKNISYDKLMNLISIVFQKVYLFEDTILNNIRFAKPNASLEEVRKACKLAHADEFIMKLEKGYDTVIKEGGSLSGGEKQRLSIARAILKDSPIIILDEATSSLDSENESLIMDAINELTKNKTVIMIAHKLNTVEKANKIISIKDGKIVEEGTCSSLRNNGGVFEDFVKAKKKAAAWKINN